MIRYILLIEVNYLSLREIQIDEKNTTYFTLLAFNWVWQANFKLGDYTKLTKN